MGPVSIPDDIVKSDKVLISWYWVFIWSHRFKIWEVSLQSDWTPSNTIKSHGFTNLRDLRWLIVFWNDSILSGDFFTMTTKYLELCIWIIRSRKWSMSFQLPFCFPILLAYGQIPASGPVYPSWSGVPPSRENNIVQGVTRLSTWAKGGGIWTDARVCLHYWVVIWVAGYSNPPPPPPPYIAQFLGYVMGRIHMALRSYSVLDILLPPIIIIMQECSQALKSCKRL